MIFGSHSRRWTWLTLLAATGCVKAPPPPAPPPRAPAPVATPTLAADWQDWPLTPGDWRYERGARGSRAVYGQPGSDVLALLRCDRAPDRMTLSRSGGGGGTLLVRTTSTTRSLAAVAAEDAPYAMAVLAPGDPLLDAIAFSRGRFTIEQAGATPLVLPPWPEIGRVIEDCRGG